MKFTTKVLIFFFLLLLFKSSAIAFFDSDVDKAKEFMQAGMYPQAIGLLEKRINDKPTDADAHYNLAICYLRVNNIRGAKERFVSSVKLEPELGYKIGDEFFKVGLYREAIVYNPNLLTKVAETLYNKGDYDQAIIYNPALKQKIAETLFQKGEYEKAVKYNADLRGKVGDIYFDKGEYEKAVEYNPQLKEKAGDIYFKKGKSSEVEKQKNLYYNKTKQFTSKYNSEIFTDLNNFYFEHAYNSYNKRNNKEFIKYCNLISVNNKGNKNFINSLNDSDKALICYYLLTYKNSIEAVNELKVLKKSGDEFAKKLAYESLSPPKQGTRNIVRKDLERVKGGKNYYTVMKKLEITSENEIVIYIDLGYSYSVGTRFNFCDKAECSHYWPYVVDNFGKKFKAKKPIEIIQLEKGITTFRLASSRYYRDGLGQPCYKDNYVSIGLKPLGDDLPKATIKVTFPPVSEGAKFINFVLPEIAEKCYMTLSLRSYHVNTIKNIPLK